VLVSSTCSYNCLANSPFHSLVFRVNELRSDEMPHFCAKNSYSEAIVQLLGNRIATVYHAAWQAAKRSLEREAEEKGGGLLIQPDLFAQTNFHLFC
jgi:hypothetical protein